MPIKSPSSKRIHKPKLRTPLPKRNVCDSDDILDRDQDFLFENTSREDCCVTPGVSEWPFTKRCYPIPAKTTVRAKTRRDLPNKRTKYTYLVHGGGCKLDTAPKNVLIP